MSMSTSNFANPESAGIDQDFARKLEEELAARKRQAARHQRAADEWPVVREQLVAAITYFNFSAQTRPEPIAFRYRENDCGSDMLADATLSLISAAVPAKIDVALICYRDGILRSQWNCPRNGLLDLDTFDILRVPVRWTDWLAKCGDVLLSLEARPSHTGMDVASSTFRPAVVGGLIARGALSN